MQTTRSRSILFVKFLFVIRFLNFFAALFRTFGMQKDEKIIFVIVYCRTRLYAKRQFPNDDVKCIQKIRNK